MTNIQCDMWCKNQINGFCNKIEIDIDDMQYVEEVTSPKCFIFDSTKASCYACENCNCDDDVCDFDGHTIDEDSTCTIDKFSCAI